MSKTVTRKLYRAAVLPENVEALKAAALADAGEARKLIDSGEILGISVFNLWQHVFVYMEVLDNAEVCPCCALPTATKLLESWPGAEKPRKYIPLMDVFHFNAPASLEHWQRKTPVTRHLGRIGQLKPERIGRYVFFHYALQEERSFGGDKYQILGASENILFCYNELPMIEEAPVLPPEVETHAVPENWADAGISPSFIPWEDKVGTGEERLREMNELVSVW